MLFSHSVTSDSVNSWTIALQAPLSMGFPRPEYWSGLPFPSPGDLSDPRLEAASPAVAGGFFSIEPSGKPKKIYTFINIFCNLLSEII